MANIKPHHVKELKKYIDNPIKVSTIDGKTFEGILGHVDDENIHIVVPINIGENHIENVGTDHVGDIGDVKNKRWQAPSYHGHVSLPIGSVSGVGIR